MSQPEQPVEADGLSQAAVAAMITAFSALVLAELTAWLIEAKAAILGGVAGVFNTTTFRALDLSWNRRVDRMIPDLIRAARKGWEETARQLGLNIPFNPHDPILVEQIARTRNLLVRVDDEIYRMVIKAIADGHDRGQGPDQIADEIDNILSVTGSENWPNRADVIALTEVTRFTEAGALSAAQRWEYVTGRRLNKRWVDRDDNRVRAAHRRVDGKTISLGSLFQVGGSWLRYPGDPTGLPHDVIYCRCHLKFVEVRT